MNRTHWVVLALAATLFSAGAAPAEAQSPAEAAGAELSMDCSFAELRGPRILAATGLSLAVAGLGSTLGFAISGSWWMDQAPFAIGTTLLSLFTVSALIVGIVGIERLSSRRRAVRRGGSRVALSPTGVWTF